MSKYVGSYPDGAAIVGDETFTVLNAAGVSVNYDMVSIFEYITETAGEVIEDTTTSRTLTLTDSEKFLKFTHVDDITVTVPLNSTTAFKIGVEIMFEQNNVGVITFVGEAGVEITNVDTSLMTADRYSVVGLKKVDVDEWVLVGSVG